MRHARTGKKLGRDSSHRRALYANLACSLIEHGRIRTTEAKAKAVKPYAEKMITLGRRGDVHARRQVLSELHSQEVVHQLFSDVDPRPAATAAMTTPANVTMPSARTKVSAKKRQRRYARTISSSATTAVAKNSAAV